MGSTCFSLFSIVLRQFCKLHYTDLLDDNHSDGEVGKENTYPRRESEPHYSGPKIGENLGSWKRIPRVGGGGAK